MSSKPNLSARVAQRAGAQPAAEQGQEETAEQGLVVIDRAAQDTWLHWLNERKSYFAAALPRHVNEAQFIQVALAALYKSEYLQKCTPESLMMALMQCATYGLDPDGVHAAVVPYGKEAKFVPMYMGYIELMYRSGMVDSVVFDFIRSGDAWSFDQGKRPPEDFFHKPDMLSESTRSPLLAYAFAWMKAGGRSQIVFLNRAEAEEIRNTRSEAYRRAEQKRRAEREAFAKNPHYGKYNSTWHTDFDAMWLKSAVRRLVKRVPTSPEIRELLKVDDELDIMDRLSGTQVVRIDSPESAHDAAPALQASAEQVSRGDVEQQIGQLFDGLDATFSADDRLRDASIIVGRKISSPSELTDAELAHILQILTDCDGMAPAWDTAVQAAEKGGEA